MNFENLSERRQRAALLGEVEKILRQYPFRVLKYELLYHGFNATFKVLTEEGIKFALRVNTNSSRTRAELNAEVEWVGKLKQETEIWVPVPQPNRSGEFITVTHFDCLDKDVPAVLYSWLPGKNVGDQMTVRDAYLMGEITRMLHHHGAQMKFSDEARFKEQPDCLFGDGYLIGNSFPEIEHEVFTKVVSDANQILARLYQEALIPVHYDVHMANVKRFRNRMSVFDFDDAILGRPVMDCFVTLYYLRGQENSKEIEDSYWAGIGGSRTSYGLTELEFETLVASRGALLANSVIQMKNAEYQKLAPKIIRVIEKRLKHFHETGVFDPRVAKFNPAD